MKKEEIAVKKMLSLVICLAMVLSFAVFAVSAEETENDTVIKYLMFASDRHGDDKVITNILSNYPYGTQVEYVGLDGDMVDGFTEYDATAVAGEATQIAANATVQIMYGSHDKNAQNADGILYRESGMLFDGDGYCVYGITFDGMGSKKGAENAAAEADEFKKWVEYQKLISTPFLFFSASERVKVVPSVVVTVKSRMMSPSSYVTPVRSLSRMTEEVRTISAFLPLKGYLASTA